MPQAGRAAGQEQQEEAAVSSDCALCCLLGGALTLGADGRPVHLACAALLPAVVVTGPGQSAATAPFSADRVRTDTAAGLDHCSVLQSQ